MQSSIISVRRAVFMLSLFIVVLVGAVGCTQKTSVNNADDANAARPRPAVETSAPTATSDPVVEGYGKTSKSDSAQDLKKDLDATDLKSLEEDATSL